MHYFIPGKNRVRTGVQGAIIGVLVTMGVEHDTAAMVVAQEGQYGKYAIPSSWSPEKLYGALHNAAFKTPKLGFIE